MKPVYFLHIHKTAGSSLIAMIDAHFEPEQVCKAQQWHQLLAIPREDLARFALFRGHFHHCFCTLLPEPPITFTFLRDPVARTFSRYLHLRREKEHYLHEHALTQDLRMFLKDPVTRSQVNNLQVRTLAYDFNIQAVAQAVGRPLTKKMEMESYVNTLMRDLPDEALLPIAIKRIEAMAFVGLTERFDDSMAVLATQFGWSHSQSIRLNAAYEPLPKEAEDPKVLEDIRQLNWADIELYSHATRLFEAKLATLTTQS